MAGPPATPPSDAKAIPLYDLESGKKPGVNVTAIDVDSTTERPVLGRRRISNNDEGATSGDKLEDLVNEDALTKFGNTIYKIHSFSIFTRYALYIFPVASILAIPLILTDTVCFDASVGEARLVGLFIWIEVIWVGLWICKLIAKAVPLIFQATCGLISTGVRKYALVLKALEVPISLLLWTITAWGSTGLINRFSTNGKSSIGWVDGPLNTAFKAAIVVAAIFLGEKTIVQLVGIDYHRKQYETKIKEAKKLIRMLDMLYEASRKLFPEYCKEFEDEDTDIHGNTAQVRQAFAKAGMRTRVFNELGRAGDKMTAAFGVMASDISGKQVFSATSAHSVVIEALETHRASEALARRIWLSFVGQNHDVLLKDDLIEVLGETRHEEVEEIFAVLDKDGNGDVSLEEMTLIVVGAGQDRKNRAKSMADIGEAIAVLDKLLSVIVLIAVAFVYASFFSTSFQSSTTQLWTTFTGLAFAIGGTVTEFLSCCIFLFVKHPYDVGDRVDISQVELVVEHISLMYSIFRRIDSDKTVQIPHNVANTLWIENISRSKHMKERYAFSVSAATKTEDLETLRCELEKFVQASENRRDFKEQVEIQLVSVGDLKQLDLRVDIQHKSNFANEILRQNRRNKFMCELLAAMRRVPIEPPGGSAPALGDPKNPSYSVAVSDTEAITARAKHATELEGKRLVPTGASATVLESMTTALQNPIVGLVGNVTGRRGSTVTSRTVRSSLESLKISQGSTRYAH